MRSFNKMAASMEDDDNFIDIGKPLQLIADDEPRKKPVHLEDMPVKDSAGRTRFHGAFTGGYSAGYFNTVGSKEGWTPSTFVSSRSKKEETVIQKPEHFMDEEDLGEHGIAPRKFTTAENFTSQERNQKRLHEATSIASSTPSIIPGAPVLIDLVVPARLPIGISLLRKMGWKEGQGTGPRLKRKTKKRQPKDARKTYGCARPPSSTESEASDDDSLKDVTFAPKDANPVNFTPKDNKHGLGYRGLDPRAALPSTHIDLFSEPVIKKSGHRKGIRGQAFGVGALEDEDESVYSVDHMSNYDVTMEMEDQSNTYGWTAPGRKQDGKALPIGYIGRILEGFSLSSKTLELKKTFPPPRISRFFRPRHTFLEGQIVKTQQPVANTHRSNITAVTRGLMLGEGSVLNLLPADDKSNLQAVAASESGEAPILGSSSLNTPDISKFFKPFSKDPAKQARYDSYLVQVKCGNKDAYKEVISGHMTEWEREREEEEFLKSAKLYKPLTGMMANRFTTAKIADSTDSTVELAMETKVDSSDQTKAAEMKMYGKLTRTSMEWHPDRLLCRRFNIPDPYPGSTIVGVPTVKHDKFSVFNFLSLPSQSEPSPKPLPPAPPDDPKTAKVAFQMKKKEEPITKSKNIFSNLIESDEQSAASVDEEDKRKTDITKSTEDSATIKNEEAVTDRPPMDLFTAIFADTESESSASSDEENKTESVVPSIPALSMLAAPSGVVSKNMASSSIEAKPDSKPENVVVNDSRKGFTEETPGTAQITANMDDDASSRTMDAALQQRLAPSEEPHDGAMYGPAPPPPQGNIPSQPMIYTSTKTIEKHNKSRQKSSHKHKRTKDKKNKHKKSKQKKHKQDKEKRRKASFSSADESSNDADSSGDEGTTGRDLLNRLKMFTSHTRAAAADFM